MCSCLFCVFYKLLLFHHLEHCQAGDCSQVIPSKCGSQHAAPWLYVRAYEYATDRETVAHALCHGDQVGTNSCMLMCEELSRAPVSRLNFVKYEQRTCGATFIFKHLEKMIRW